MILCRSPTLFRRLPIAIIKLFGGRLVFPSFKIVDRLGDKLRFHLVVAPATQFRTQHFVVTGHGGIEPDRNHLAGDRVLFHSQFRNEERMLNVIGPECDRDKSARRDVQFVD